MFFTDEICFEMDLAKTMIDMGRRRELDRIINTVAGEHSRATSDMIKKACRKLDVNFHDYPPRMLGNVNARNIKALYILLFCLAVQQQGRHPGPAPGAVPAQSGNPQGLCQGHRRGRQTGKSISCLAADIRAGVIV